VRDTRLKQSSLIAFRCILFPFNTSQDHLSVYVRFLDTKISIISVYKATLSSLPDDPIHTARVQ
jgi:hypothetical protein